MRLSQNRQPHELGHPILRLKGQDISQRQLVIRVTTIGFRILFGVQIEGTAFGKPFHESKTDFTRDGMT